MTQTQPSVRGRVRAFALHIGFLALAVLAPQCSIQTATALRTGTVNAGGEKISVGCLIRLEMNEAAGAFRLTVRTAVPHVSTALAEAIQKLL